MIIVIILLGIWAIAATALHFRNPLPFPDKGSRTFACSSPKAMEAIVRICEVNGLRPIGRIDSGGMTRALLETGLYLNYTPPQQRERWGNPNAGLAFQVKNPVRAASIASMMLKQMGFSATVHNNPDTDLPTNSMVFVETDAFCGSILVFRLHVLKLGGRPPKWTYKET